MLGAVISAVGGLASSFLSKSSSDKANAQQAAIAQKNIALQKRFAKQGIRWKVEDAKRAGIHPLYALGAQTNSFAPVGVGSSTPDWSGIAGAGQDIGRAIDATRTGAERATAYQQTVEDLTVQRMGLENQLLGAQIAKVTQAGQPPARPALDGSYFIDGQGLPPGVSLTNDIPMKRNLMSPTNPGQEPGAIADIGWSKTMIGGLPAYNPTFSENMADRMDEDHFGSAAWTWRNRVLPSFGVGQNPPPFPLPEGYDAWLYSPVYQAYRPYRKSWTGIHY